MAPEPGAPLVFEVGHNAVASHDLTAFGQSTDDFTARAMADGGLMLGSYLGEPATMVPGHPPHVFEHVPGEVWATVPAGEGVAWAGVRDGLATLWIGTAVFDFGPGAITHASANGHRYLIQDGETARVAELLLPSLMMATAPELGTTRSVPHVVHPLPEADHLEWAGAYVADTNSDLTILVGYGLQPPDGRWPGTPCAMRWRWEGDHYEGRVVGMWNLIAATSEDGTVELWRDLRIFSETPPGEYRSHPYIIRDDAFLCGFDGSSTPSLPVGTHWSAGHILWDWGAMSYLDQIHQLPSGEIRVLLHGGRRIPSDEYPVLPIAVVVDAP